MLVQHVRAADAPATQHSTAYSLTSMGSSRFLKAIRARHRNGPIVVKTFIKPDPGMSLRNLVRRLRGTFAC